MRKRKYVHPLDRPVRKVDGELNALKALDELVPDSQIKVAVKKQAVNKKQADFNEINQQMRDRGYQFMTSETDDGGVSYKLMDADPNDVGTLTQELGNTYEGYSFNYDPGQNGMSEFSINPSPQFRMQQAMPDMGEIDVTGDGLGMSPQGLGDADDAGSAGSGGGVPTANDIPADAGTMYAGRKAKQAFNWPNMPGDSGYAEGDRVLVHSVDAPGGQEEGTIVEVDFDDDAMPSGANHYEVAFADGSQENLYESDIISKVADWDEEDWDADRSEFADPGGESALRAESPSNPRNLPCPTCGEPNKLTPKDVAKGYQCDDCARRDEGYGY